MAAEYKLVRRPGANKPDEKQPLYPRFVPSDTMRLEDLVRMTKGRSSFSSADIKGMLQLIQDVMVDALMYGRNIELDGIGTFSVSLKARPVMDKKEIRAESIRFQDVTFRSSRRLRERLEVMPLSRSDQKERVGFTADECEARTMQYLDTHTSISGKIYRSLCHCGKTKASTDLRRMEEAGLLVRKYVGNTVFYQIPKPKEEGSE